jgi:nucleoside-diphosphate-sugar epimerase
LTSGEQKRDFIYVEDVSEALVRLGIAPAAPGDIVNLATGCLTSVRDFVETAARILKIPEDQLRFGELPPLPEEMHHSEVTTERLRRLTGWAPSTMIEEGIRKTIAGIPSPHSPLTVF